jgi:hypothetical protein
MVDTVVVGEPVTFDLEHLRADIRGSKLAPPLLASACTLRAQIA